MRALISPKEAFEHEYISGYETDESGKMRSIKTTIENCTRVADVCSQEFPVASPLFWVDCPDNAAADVWAYKEGVVFELPQNAKLPSTPVQEV
jgi:hypothetical protein